MLVAGKGNRPKTFCNSAPRVVNGIICRPGSNVQYPGWAMAVNTHDGPESFLRHLFRAGQRYTGIVRPWPGA